MVHRSVEYRSNLDWPLRIPIPSQSTIPNGAERNRWDYGRDCTVSTVNFHLDSTVG